MIKAIIIDDEMDGREGLQLAIKKFCLEVEVSALASSPAEGLQLIQATQPDLIFLDIQMPHMSGFQLLEALGEFDFEVIFVTAHDQYAIKAIKFSALDYLLKPVDIDELQKAVQKAKERILNKSAKNNYASLLKNMQHPMRPLEKLAIPTLEGVVLEPIKDIIYCQADRNYTNLILKGARKIVVSKNLKDFENMLADSGFFRVHHATLINIAHVKKYIKGEGGYVVMEEGHHLDVSRRKKEAFLQLLHKI